MSQLTSPAWGTLGRVGGTFACAVLFGQSQVFGQSPPHAVVLEGIEVGSAAFVPRSPLVLFTARDSLFVYDRDRRQPRGIAGGEFSNLTVSPSSDRIAFSRASTPGGPSHVWTMEIDARTGAPTSGPRQVSATVGDVARFSPRGDAIAFRTTGTNGAEEVRVVSSLGGGERVVATFPVRAIPFWSADGAQLIVRVRASPKEPVVLKRVALSGGSPTTVDTLADASRVLHADGVQTIYVSAGTATQDPELVYRSAREDTTHVPIPRDSFIGDWSAVDERAPVIDVSYRATVRTIDVSSGEQRDITPSGMQARAPRWSPDGQRLVLEIARDTPFQLAVMKPDGSGRKDYPVPVSPINVQLMWSPDGRRVAYRTMMQLYVLDLASGVTRQLGGAVHPHHLAWRSDNRSLMVARIPDINVRPLRVALFDTPLDSRARPTVDINALFPAEDPLGYFPSADAFLLLNPERVLVNAMDGTARTLPGVGARTGAPGATADGQWLLFGVTASSGPMRQLELIDVEHGTARTIDVSFDAHTAGFNRPALSPDHRSAVVLGRDGAPGWKFFRVQLDSGTSRVIAEVPGYPQQYHFDLSPDGRTLIYTTDVPARSTIDEVRPRRPR